MRTLLFGLALLAGTVLPAQRDLGVQQYKEQQRRDYQERKLREYEQRQLDLQREHQRQQRLEWPCIY